MKIKDVKKSTLDSLIRFKAKLIAQLEEKEDD